MENLKQKMLFHSNKFQKGASESFLNLKMFMEKMNVEHIIQS